MDTVTKSYRAQTIALRAQTVRDWQKIWPGLKYGDLAGTYQTWEASAATLIARDRTRAAGLASLYLKAHRTAAGVPGEPLVRLAEALPAEQVATSLRATSLAAIKKSTMAGKPADLAMRDAFVQSSGAASRMVLNAGRDTVRATTVADPKTAGWQRFTAGGCDFCQMLAGRGSVYTEATADFDAHDHCVCGAEPVYDSDAAVLPRVDVQASMNRLEAEKQAAAVLKPEPEFVDRLANALRDGSVTPEQLRAGAAKASPLGQANAEAALAKYEAEVAAKAARSAAAVPDKFVPKTPEGSVASKVDFPREALDALLPKGGWTTATREKTVASLRQTPEGRQLLKTMDSFQSGGSTAIPRLRTDIEKYLTGNVGEMPQGRIDAIENFLSAVGRSNAGDRNLYRGMSIPGDIEDVAARYKAGDDLDLSLASFSSDKKLAQDFTLQGAGKKVRAKTKTPVLIEWIGEGKRALPIEKLSKSRVFANEKEWVGAGRYSIEGVKRVKKNGVETLVLTIRQKGIW